MRYVLLGAVLLSSAVCVLGGTHSAGLKWLDENAKKDGVVKLPSGTYAAVGAVMSQQQPRVDMPCAGLQYKVVRKGTGTDHPTASSSCECHYEGTLIDGTKFDSSYDRGSPTSFAPNQVCLLRACAFVHMCVYVCVCVRAFVRAACVRVVCVCLYARMYACVCAPCTHVRMLMLIIVVL